MRDESRSRQAGDFMEDLGEHIGRAAARAAHGLQQMTAAATSGQDGKLMDQAEEIVKQLEGGLGSLASSASHGFWQVAGRAREEYGDISSEAQAVAHEAGAVAHDGKRDRAEDAVKRVGTRIGEMAGAAGHGIRRIAARAREEYDDIRAEAEVKRVGGAEDTGVVS